MGSLTISYVQSLICSPCISQWLSNLDKSPKRVFVEVLAEVNGAKQSPALRRIERDLLVVKKPRLWLSTVNTSY